MASNPRPRPSPEPPESASHELAARQTGMSFQRTRLSADRTLMSVIRTSLSLIGFGFTIFQVFEKLYQSQVLLGIFMLVLGIGYHISFMLGLRRLRAEMKMEGLIHGESQFPASLTLI